MTKSKELLYWEPILEKRKEQQKLVDRSLTPEQKSYLYDNYARVYYVDGDPDRINGRFILGGDDAQITEEIFSSIEECLKFIDNQIFERDFSNS